MKKAYGFPVRIMGMKQDLIYGICIDEDGNLLGRHISPDEKVLSENLKDYAKDLEYEFVYRVPYSVITKFLEKEKA